jgi:hypothetical protein
MLKEPTMRVAYLTTDEVNEHLAVTMAAACDIQLVPRAPRETPPDGEFDAVLYDWDYLPPEQRQELRERLHAGHGPGRVIVHGYNLSKKEVAAWRQQGIAVFRRLESKVFRALLRAARVRVRSHSRTQG